MKKEINSEEVAKFQKNSNIFTVLLLATMVLPIPLIKLASIPGAVAWGVIAVAGLYMATVVEKQKKYFNIQTYKEIVAFTEGKEMNEIDSAKEEGKRPYQKILLALGAAAITLIVAIILDLVL